MSPRASQPQQATEPSVFTPQVNSFPALTEVNSPYGGVAWRSESQPQQATEPSTMTPQLYPDPALTETNLPAGGMFWPSKSDPQQATEPSVITPQGVGGPGADTGEFTCGWHGLAGPVIAPAGD